MKIAIITSGILPVPAVQGGAVENLIDYALEYNDQHQLHDITVYSIFHPKVKSLSALNSTVNKYVYINTNTILFKYISKIRVYLGYGYYYHHRLEYFLECAWRRMKKQKYDLIIIENRPCFAIPLSERTSTPIISHIHTNLLYEPNPVFQKAVLATKRFIVVSQYIKNEISKVGIDTDIRIVYNGIEKTIFHRELVPTIDRKKYGLEKNDFVAVFCGRLVPKKGIKELLLAMKLLKDYSDIKLLVIGSINYEDTDLQTNTFIEELKSIANTLSGKIVFTGFISYKKVPEYLSLGNVTIVPSQINEALGMTCIESCAMGLPVIATNDGGIPETLIGQKHILIEKNNKLPQNIANAILEIKNHYSSYLGNNLNPIFSKEIFAKSFFDNLLDI